MLLKSLSTITPGLNYFTVNGGLQTCSDYSLFGRTSDYHIYIWEKANAVVFIWTAPHGPFKGIVHFEIKIWYLSAYPKGIQDVVVFFSSVDPILMFLGQTVLVCQSYNGRYRSLSL